MRNNVIWSKDDCPFCVAAKQLFDTYNFKYEVIDVYQNKEAFREEFPDAKTVPQIIYNGKKIGGYNELFRAFEDENILGGGHSIV